MLGKMGVYASDCWSKWWCHADTAQQALGQFLCLPHQILTVLETKESYYCYLLTVFFSLLFLSHLELMFGVGLVSTCNCSAISLAGSPAVGRGAAIHPGLILASGMQAHIQTIRVGFQASFTEPQAFFMPSKLSGIRKHLHTKLGPQRHIEVEGKCQKDHFPKKTELKTAGMNVLQSTCPETIAE